MLYKNSIYQHRLSHRY